MKKTFALISLSLVALLSLIGIARAQSGALSNAILEAMDKRDVAAVRNLLDSDPAAVRAKDTVGDPLLHHAVLMDDIPLQTLLLEKGADINEANKAGLTPLRLAMRYRRINTVAFLLKRGAKVDLWTAAGLDQREQAKALIQADPSRLEAKDDYGWTPLFWAINDNHTEMVNLLLAAGADINARNSTGMTPLNWAVYSQNHPMAELLLEKGADVNIPDTHGFTPLRHVSWSRDLLERLLAKGADVNSPDELGNTLLFNVSDLTLTAELIAKGAHVNAKNRDGQTPLFNASSVEWLDLLLAKGADLIHAKDKNGITPLHYAAMRETKDLAARMIQKGANVNAKSAEGWTPLHYAASAGRKEVVEYLIAQGADVNAQDKNGIAPIGTAALAGFLLDPAKPIHQTHSISPRAMVDLLRTDYRAEPDFYASIFLGQTERVAAFLKRDPALANGKVPRGITPLQFAASVGNRDIAALLLQNGAKTLGFIPGTYSADIAWLAKWKHHDDVAELITTWRRDHHEVKILP